MIWGLRWSASKTLTFSIGLIARWILLWSNQISRAFLNRSRKPNSASSTHSNCTKTPCLRSQHKVDKPIDSRSLWRCRASFTKTLKNKLKKCIVFWRNTTTSLNTTISIAPPTSPAKISFLNVGLNAMASLSYASYSSLWVPTFPF